MTPGKESLALDLRINEYLVNEIMMATAEIMKRTITNLRKEEKNMYLLTVAHTLEVYKLTKLFLPADFLTEVTPVLMVHIDNMITGNQKQAIDLGNSCFTNLSIVMMRGILFPCISALDMRFIKNRYSQKGLIHNLHTLTHLEELKIPEECCSLPSLTVRLKYLNNLTTFILKKSSTDAMISKLAEHCPQIRHLDVQNSAEITKESRSHFLRLQNLVYLNISSTSISKEDYTYILTKLEKIINISWKDYGTEEILNGTNGELLENKAVFEGKFLIPRKVVERCPNIKTFELDTNDIINLTPITNLFLLTNLSLNNLNFKKCNLEQVFDTLGERLEELTFYKIDELNVHSVIKNCNLLHILLIHQCNLVFTEIKVDGNLPHFHRLTKLSLVRNIGYEEYIDKINYYKCLTYLHLDIVEDIGNNFFNKAIESGAFKHLQQFYFKGVANFNLKVAKNLINSSPQLNYLGFWRHWRGVTETEIKVIKYMARIKKYNIQISESNWFEF